MTTPRAMTEEEVRTVFLDHIARMVDYWEHEPRADTLRDRLEGVAFSILAALDGGAMTLPGFRVYPNPHKSDKAYNRKKGRNWYPNDVDIAGGLHEHWYEAIKRYRKTQPGCFQSNDKETA